MIENAIIVEDHFTARKILAKHVNTLDKSINCLVAANLAEARHCIQTHPIDLALLDINLPDGSGIDFIAELRRTHPKCYIVMSTVYDDDETLFKALRCGANGYLLKQDPAEIILAALTGILAGSPPLSPSIAQRMVAFFHPGGVKTKKILTARESDVLVLLANGYHRKEISQSLEIAPTTVSGYIKQIYTKLEVNSCAEATLKAVGMGLVNPAEPH